MFQVAGEVAEREQQAGKSGTKPGKQRGMDGLFGCFRHDDIQIVMSKHLFFFEAAWAIGAKMSSLEDEWKSKFTFHSSLHDHHHVWNFSCPPRQVFA